MTYVQGFIIAVPAENRDEYRRFAAEAWPIFAELGAVRLVEAWEEDVADGKDTDFRRAVQARRKSVTLPSATSSSQASISRVAPNSAKSGQAPPA